MSVGNLATQGDKKNNWTWQNAVLQLLGSISTNTGGGGSSVVVSNLPLTLGQKTMAASAAVVIASDQAAIPVTTDKAATSTNTAVGRAITVGGVLILAANAARKGATVTNNSGAILYLKFDVIGTTSATSFTVRLAANAYYEVPFQYTGAISGIWASAGAGAALISELT